MEPEINDPTLRDYLAIVRRRWLVIAAIVALALAASLAYSLVQVPIYEAEAQMLVTTRDSDSLFDNGMNLSGTDATRQLQTEIQVLEGEQVRAIVQENLNISGAAPAVNAAVIGSTNVLAVRVKSPDPSEAATLANAYVDAYTENRRNVAVNDLMERATQVQNQITELGLTMSALDPDDPSRQRLEDQQAAFQEIVSKLEIDSQLKTGGASLVQTAKAPNDPISPKPIRAAVAASMFGLMIGLAVAFALDYFDDSVHSQNELEQISRLPVLASVPPTPVETGLPISVSHPHKPASEAYRSLRTNIKFLALGSDVKTIIVTSATISEGKSTTAANLAVVLAQAGRNVVLVDADLRRPRAHKFFDTSVSPGLVDWIVEDSAISARRRVILPTGEALEVVPAGKPPQNPGELLIGNRVQVVIDELVKLHDHVIIDSAPVLPVSDTLAIAGRADGVLMVVDAAQARKTNVIESIERLTRIGANMIGIVYNNAKANTSSYYSDSYNYGFAYSQMDGASGEALDRASALPHPSNHRSQRSSAKKESRRSAEDTSLLARRRARRSDDSDIWNEVGA